MKRILLIVILLSVNLSLYSQSWVWGVQGTTGSDAWAAKADVGGNVYMTGPFEDSISFDGNKINSPGQNCYLVKYNSSGKLVWNAPPSKLASLNSSISPYGMTLDKFGNEYVTGIFSDTAYFGLDTIRNVLGLSWGGPYPSGYSVFLTKYDANGNIVWARQGVLATQACNGYGQALATDQTGDIYMAGVFNDTITFGSFILKSPSKDIFLVKYDTNGNVVWAKQSNSVSTASEAGCNSIAIDVSGNIYFPVFISDTVSFGANMLNDNNGSCCLLKYDTAGNIQWIKQGLGGYSYSITTDNSGNFYMTGLFSDTAVFTLDTLITGGYQDIFLVKCNSQGNAIWARQSLTSYSYWSGYSVATDNNGFVYLSAGSEFQGNGKINFGGKSFPYDSNGTDPSLVVKLDSSGNILCGSSITTGGDDLNSIVVDPSGEYVYLGGDIESSIVFGTDILYNNASESPFIARWKSCEGGPQDIDAVRLGNIYINVYPNPFASSANLVFNANGKHYLEVDDITGRKLESIECSGTQYELSRNGFASGVYFIKAWDEGQKYVVTKKVVVQ